MSEEPSPQHRAIQQFLAETPFCHGLPAAVIEEMVSTAHVDYFAANQPVVHDGEISSSLRIVRQGRLVVASDDSHHYHSESLWELHRGSAFGEGPVTGEPERAEYRALTDVTTYSWPADVLQPLCDHHPGLRDQLRVRLSLYGQIRELVGLLQHSSLFHDVSPVMIRSLLFESTLLHFEADEPVFRKGDVGDAMYVVVHGEVSILKPHDKDPQKPPEQVNTMRRGEVFGHVSLVSSEPRAVSAVCSESAEILRVGAGPFDSICRRSTFFYRELLRLSRQRVAKHHPMERVAPRTALINRTTLPTEQIARFVAASIQAQFGERALVVRVDRDGSRDAAEPAWADESGLRTTTLEPEGWSAAVDKILDDETMDQVLVYSQTNDTAVEAQLVESDAAILFVADDPELLFPYELGPVQPIKYCVELGTRSSNGVAHHIQCGVVRTRMAAAIAQPNPTPRQVARDSQGSFDRIARAITDRTVGVALGGGGAWGIAHHALLRRLHQRGVPVDAVAGVSFGSLAGAAYASRGLEGLDALSGREKVFRYGSLSDAVRASGSFPGVCEPVIIDGHRYVDGAIVNSVPASVLPEEGMDFIIGSDVAQPPTGLKPASENRVSQLASSMWLPWRVRDSVRSMFLMLAKAGQHDVHGAHTIFSPKIVGLTASNFRNYRAIIEQVEPQVEHFVDDAVRRYRAYCTLRQQRSVD
jgi:CRP-like cAMP-binding protein